MLSLGKLTIVESQKRIERRKVLNTRPPFCSFLLNLKRELKDSTEVRTLGLIHALLNLKRELKGLSYHLIFFLVHFTVESQKRIESFSAFRSSFAFSVTKLNLKRELKDVLDVAYTHPIHPNVESQKRIESKVAEVWSSQSTQLNLKRELKDRSRYFMPSSESVG